MAGRIGMDVPTVSYGSCLLQWYSKHAFTKVLCQIRPKAELENPKPQTTP